MALGSNVNPNFPIPGLDQNSKGFRDNFAIIKREIEQIQGTTVQFAGAVIGGPVQLGSSDSIVINTAVNGSIVALDPPYRAIQYNEDGFLKGSLNFVYDSGNVSIGLGTSIDPNVSISTSKPVRVRNELSIVANVLAATANLTITTVNSNVRVSNLDSHVEIGVDKPLDLNIRNSNGTLLYLTKTANVGINTDTPTAAFHLVSSSKDVGRVFTNKSASDNIFRFVTSDTPSTIGIGLEHTAFGWLGGLRIDNQGTISIHSGESQGAYLSTASARITIDNAGSVGIGIYNPVYNLDVNGTFRSNGIHDNSDDLVKIVGINNSSPVYTLDVNGDIATSGAVVNLPMSITTVDLNPIIIDSWPISSYRTAKYTLQAVFGTPEIVHIFEFVCFHATGTGYVMPITDMSSGISLGSISVNINTNFMEVYFTGTNIGTVVSTSKSFIKL